jgi:hypothetical protein
MMVVVVVVVVVAGDVVSRLRQWVCELLLSGIMEKWLSVCPNGRCLLTAEQMIGSRIKFGCGMG